jgi:hypothetical protein
MSKRRVAALLWVGAAWYAWSVFASAAGLPEAIGLPIGLASGWFVWLDPTGRIWATGERRAPGTPAVAGVESI